MVQTSHAYTLFISQLVTSIFPSRERDAKHKFYSCWQIMVGEYSSDVRRVSVCSSVRNRSRLKPATTGSGAAVWTSVSDSATKAQTT
ncbi:hypothetical protein CY34DRAFT_616110 [Suillus luteus UH-Slu-Lm8-n1]|uniref:Uncharacterized protein n=1 Tax=Suillus luteus UH-Slu-Lm8-n1 TaxID=930992 RepID=A0A0D0BMY1_9AGAM|nr:hypothetical protein CY34DRAFT_616110 [Suillus luteus UH-Slu-Lm8-n1]